MTKNHTHFGDPLLWDKETWRSGYGFGEKVTGRWKDYQARWELSMMEDSFPGKGVVTYTGGLPIRSRWQADY